MILRDYQAELVGQTQLQWALGNRVVLARLDTGAGKTPCLSKIVEDHNGFVAAIAHRDKLVEQISLTLARAGIRHDLVASEKTKRLIAKKHVRKIGQCFYVPGARCRVISIDTLTRAKGLEKWAAQVTLWIVDECFPAGTMVDGRPIETLRVGDHVTAYNEKTGDFEQRRVSRLYQNKAPKYMVRVALSEHHAIHCTYGHPFWTRQGWVEAYCLTEQDEVFLHDVPARPQVYPVPNAGREVDRITPLHVAKDRTNILFDQVRNALSGSPYYSERTRGGRGSRLFDLPRPGGAKGAAALLVSEDAQSVLQQDVQFDLSKPMQFGNDGPDQPGSRIRPHDRTQPDEACRGTRKGQRNSSQPRTSAAGAGRQRPTSPSRRGDAIGDCREPGFHPASGNSDPIGAQVRVSVLLQSGRGEPGSEDCNRSGRVVAPDIGPPSAGPKERYFSGWARLDRVTLYERGDPEFAGECLDDGFVYNIEVEGLHTYIADGAVVHNCHHVLRENKWGRGVSLFTHPQCKGLGLTATPGRPDGKGLGRHADGFADVMVEGPPMRWLIDEGFLCDYDVVCPPSDLVADEAPKGSDGEYTQAQRRTAERKSHIVGDVPKHYLKFAAGLSGITFCGTIETAVDTVAAYRALGVSAELITGDTDSNIRDQIFERAERGELNQIVAVDVISEGVDIPALQVGSFGRLTGSIITWRQQIGRLLRPIYAPGYDLETREGRLAAIAASKKPRALLIDHVGGFVNPNLGPPDKPRVWTLDRREKRAKSEDDDEIPMRICANPDIDCFKPTPRTVRACVHCGYEPEPMGRSAPEHVDGDLQLMTPEALAVLQGRVLDIHMSRAQHDAQQIAKGAPQIGLNRHWNGYLERRDALVALTASMDLWAGQLHAAGHADHEIQRTFYLTYGVDIVSAQGLDAKDARELKERIDRRVNAAYGLAA